MFGRIFCSDWRNLRVSRWQKPQWCSKEYSAPESAHHLEHDDAAGDDLGAADGEARDGVAGLVEDLDGAGAAAAHVPDARPHGLGRDEHDEHSHKLLARDLQHKLVRKGNEHHTNTTDLDILIAVGTLA